MQSGKNASVLQLSNSDYIFKNLSESTLLKMTQIN
jgi:hypothetical protein